MKTKALNAAQIDTLAQRLSEDPIEPATSAKKAGDTFARLLATRIGIDRGAFGFASIMTAATAEQAEARLTLVLDYGNTETAADTIPVPTDEPKAVIGPITGKPFSIKRRPALCPRRRIFRKPPTPSSAPNWRRSSPLPRRATLPPCEPSRSIRSLPAPTPLPATATSA